MSTLQIPSQPDHFAEIVAAKELGATILERAAEHLGDQDADDLDARFRLRRDAQRLRKIAAGLAAEPPHPCTSCGVVLSGRDSLCYDCTIDAGWQLLANVGLAANQVIIRGTLYYIGEEPKHGTPRKYLGFDGQEKRIRRGDELIITHNLWLRSDVPWKYRTALPDNATFVRADSEEGI